MRQIELLKTTWWLRDTFPDLLWVCALLSENSGTAWTRASRLLDVIDRIRAEQAGPEKERDHSVLDGRLTSLESVAPEWRERILDETGDAYFEAVSTEFANALGMYPGAPGHWVIGRWFARGLVVDWEKAQCFLSRVIVDARHGQGEVATRAKMFVLARHAKSGAMRMAKSDPAFELFPRWPDGLSEDERGMVESVGRASFGAMAEHRDQSAEGVLARAWSADFWRSNWHKYPCRWSEDQDGAFVAPDEVRELQDVLRQDVDELLERFHTKALRSDPDVYLPDRYEVLTGLASRALRLLAVAVDAPVLWSMEYGAVILRAVLESLIVLRWLLAEEREDPGIYSHFKDYGRGKLKLLLLHWRNHVGSSEPEVAESLERLVAILEAEVNEDVGEEYQDINVAGTFAGIDMRRMARAVGMEDDYRLVFAPTSAVAHGEWWTISRYSMERCTNPLHLGHRAPRRELMPALDPPGILSALGFARELVDAYEQVIAPRPRLIAAGWPMELSSDPIEAWGESASSRAAERDAGSDTMT